MEAIAALRQAGLQVEAWSLLSRSSRIVFRLEPSGLIAKVGPLEASSRFDLELAVARHVAGREGPVAAPASQAGPYRSAALAISVWQPVTILGPLPEVGVCPAYAALQEHLESFAERLPDFRLSIHRAKSLADMDQHPSVCAEDARVLRAVFSTSIGQLESFQWRNRALHGDPHAGNLVLTPDGQRWLDFESACSGPIEWDLSAFKLCGSEIPHDRQLLAVLKRLRRACVVAWCAAKPAPNLLEAEAIAYHLACLKATTE